MTEKYWYYNARFCKTRGANKIMIQCRITQILVYLTKHFT